MRMRTGGIAALVVAAGLTTSACATDDPAFWDGVALGADITALALESSYDCHGCRYRHRDHDRRRPPRHRDDRRHKP